VSRHCSRDHHSGNPLADLDEPHVFGYCPPPGGARPGRFDVATVGETEIIAGASTATAQQRPPPPAAHRAFVTSAGWRVNQIASSRFGTQHSQAIAAYAVSKEKSTIPAAASPS
jgi:hypothetical protein